MANHYLILNKIFVINKFPFRQFAFAFTTFLLHSLLLLLFAALIKCWEFGTLSFVEQSGFHMQRLQGKGDMLFCAVSATVLPFWTCLACALLHKCNCNAHVSVLMHTIFLGYFADWPEIKSINFGRSRLFILD